MKPIFMTRLGFTFVKYGNSSSISTPEANGSVSNFTNYYLHRSTRITLTYYVRLEVLNTV